jgi:hypothetical protein
MSYQSVDQLQKVLASKVFHYTKDAKKASGRALGTLVEIITFYLLKSWGFENSVAIEKPLSEYGNPEITHNVEYSLHPILRDYDFTLHKKLPITSTRLLGSIDVNEFPINGFERTNNTLLTSELILRNSCIVANRKAPYASHLMSNLHSITSDEVQIRLLEQFSKPYAMFECKRVGVEEGMKKGPQTIEKAKQGAYVARIVSSLHKVRLPSGELHGLIYKQNGEIYTKPYVELISDIINSDDAELLKDFILTVGVVSNHGNWFTSDNHNKELKVLAQSYDWLLFLTDEGLAEFITELLLKPQPLLKPARKAFLASYTAEKKKNAFTKVQMDYEADQVLQSYFSDNLSTIEQWFNIITPKNWSMQKLHEQISQLRDKNWEALHSL